MDEIYEWLNPRVSIEYVLFSFLVLCVAIVVVMLMTKGKMMMRLVLGALLTEYYFLLKQWNGVFTKNRIRNIKLMP